MPPRRVQIIGTILSTLIARVPWLWPLLRRPTQRFWDRMAASWGSRSTTAGRMQPLEAALGRVDSPRRILEIGTGSGEGAALMAERFPNAEITAVDISQNMLEIARGSLPERVRLVRADAGALPFEDAAFDLVVQMNVPVYFSELARVTAARGCVVVTSSFGPATPYYTPHAVLRRKFARRGLRERAAEASPPGDFFIACRPS
jgi:ubiquinone/menaquinone biosynthesis C-methylase UbiE